MGKSADALLLSDLISRADQNVNDDDWLAYDSKSIKTDRMS